MSLFLRNNLTRPLSHNELDSNFIYVNIAEWVKKGYKQGQYVLIKSEDIGFIYYCENTHTNIVYDRYNNGNFLETFVENGVTKRIWRRIGSLGGSGSGITGYNFDGTIATIQLNTGSSFSVDINEVELENEQYSIGVSNHSYQSITTGWTGEVISGDTYNTTQLIYGKTEQPAKQNIVVVDLNTNEDFHHLIYLPTNGMTQNNAGVMYKIIVKSSNNSNLDKYLMIYSETIRLIGVNVKTKYQNSYFLPLETMESVEIIWDGNDYLITNLVKQEYTSLNAKNFIDTNNDPLFDTCYIERDINNLI